MVVQSEANLQYLPGYTYFNQSCDVPDIGSHISYDLSYGGSTNIWGLKRPHNLLSVGFLPPVRKVNLHSILCHAIPINYTN